MNFKADLIRLSVDRSLSVSVEIDTFLTIGIIALLVIVLILRLVATKGTHALIVDEAELGIGSQKIKLKANTADMQIAYSLWVEMSTRTVGVPIDKEHDLVHEIYRSWYEFFSVSRTLLKDIPITKYRHRKTAQIVQVAIAILNSEMRPHLTKWQAKYQRWYAAQTAKPENVSVAPNEIQETYPEYEQLMAELCDVNSKLANYRGVLRSLFV